jgi:hypothetical protein
VAVTVGQLGAKIVKVTVCGMVVKFVRVPEMDTTCPGDASSIPPTSIDLSLVHVAAIAGLPPKVIVVIVPPEHIV